MNQTCLKCNSEKLIPKVKVINRNDFDSENTFNLAIDENRMFFVIKQRIYSNVTAKLCADCGYIEFYAEKPQTLYKAYQNLIDESNRTIK